MKIFILLSLFFFSACGALPDPSFITTRSPEVVSVTPGEGEALLLKPKFTITFSEPMDEESFKLGAIFLSEGNVTHLYPQNSDLYKAIDKGTLSKTLLEFFIQKDGASVIVVPQGDLLPDTLYTLGVTSKILSQERVPLDQGRSGSLQSFMEVYQTGPASASSDTDDFPDDEPPVDEVPVVTGTVVVNEIFYDALDSDTDGFLFVELFGTPLLPLGGFKVNFVNGSDGAVYDSMTLPANAKIAADGFFVIADTKTGSSTESRVVGFDLLDNFDPQNGPDAVQLVDKDGHLLDAVGYGVGITATAQNGLESFEGVSGIDVVSGHSLGRALLGGDTDNNQTDFVDQAIPTPRH